MQQDVVHALLRSSTLFINFLCTCSPQTKVAADRQAAHAHDQALERSGKSITAGDVLKAVTELDFGPADALVPILEQELAGTFVAGLFPLHVHRHLALCPGAYGSPYFAADRG